MKANYLEIQAFTQYIHAITSGVGMKCLFDVEPDGTPYNNGKELHLFKLSSALTTQDLMRLRAYIVHEVGHKKYTDFDILRQKPELSVPVGTPSLVKDVWAQLEDHRVDYLTIHKDNYLGDKHTLMHLEELIGDSLVPQYIEHAKSLDFESTVKGAVYAMDVGHRDSFLPGSGLSGEAVEQALLTEAKRKKVVQKILKHRSTLDEVRSIEDPRLGSEATYQLAKRLVKDAQDQEDEDKEEQEQNGGDSGEGDGDEEQEVSVDPTSFKPQHEDNGKAPTTDRNLPPPEHDTEHLTDMSGMEDFAIVNFPKRSIFLGSEANIRGAEPFEMDSEYRHYNNAVDSILAGASTAQLQNEVRRILQVRSRSITAYNQKRGKLSSKDVYRVTMKDATGFNERVFNRKREALSLDVDVSVLCDFSGSMSGHRLENAIAATSMLSDTLRSLQINHEVAGFTTGYHSIIHMLFKEFGVPNRKLKDDMCLGAKMMGCNSDADNVIFAASRLKGQRAKRKVLIVLSDGSPASYKDGNDSLTLTKVLEEVPKSGVEIIGLGICTDYGKHMYPVWETLASASDLEVGLLNLLRKRIFNV